MTAVLVGISLGIPKITHANENYLAFPQKPIYIKDGCIGGCPENSYCAVERIKIDINTSAPFYKCKCHANYIQESGQLPTIVAGDFNASREELNSISSIFEDAFLESVDDGIDHILIGTNDFMTYYENTWTELDYFFEYYNSDGLIHSDHSIISKRVGVALCPALKFEDNECL